MPSSGTPSFFKEIISSLLSDQFYILLCFILDYVFLKTCFPQTHSLFLSPSVPVRRNMTSFPYFYFFQLLTHSVYAWNTFILKSLSYSRNPLWHMSHSSPVPFRYCCWPSQSGPYAFAFSDSASLPSGIGPTFCQIPHTLPRVSPFSTPLTIVPTNKIRFFIDGPQ